MQGIVLAGSADFKAELARSDLFDPRLLKAVIKTVDVSYGGENGFNQAVELSADTLGSVKLVKEKKLLQKYMDEISQDTGRYCFMVEDTLKALDQGAVENLIIWENLEIVRYELKDSASGAPCEPLYLTSEQEKNDAYFKNPETGVELEVVSKEPLVEWMAIHYKDYGCNLDFVTDKSGEGTQFVKGFGGIGGILRWKLDFSLLSEDANKLDLEGDDSDSDEDGNASDDYGFDDGDFGF